jgi:putative ABC transport system permease protein
MRGADVFRLSRSAVQSSRLRSSLIVIAMAIGVGAVILLISLGESARRYVVGEFASLGTNLIIVLPGRSETTGGPPPLFGETPRDLTIDDAMAVTRSPHISGVAPVIVGSAPVTFAGKEREVTILGSTHAMAEVRHLEIGIGRFLPKVDPHQPVPVCVLGGKVRNELFGSARVLGQWLRVGDRRCRVIGVLAEGGISIGVDFDDLVVIPVASAQALFDSPSLFRLLAEAHTSTETTTAVDDIRRIISERHDGEDDITIITQDSVVATFDKVLRALTWGLAGIASISLLVAGILIMNVMLVAVAQRKVEIGLLKAIGATGRQIRFLFLTEAVLISLIGSCLGWGLAATSVAVLARIYPTFTVVTPLWAAAVTLTLALVTGTVFGVMPAGRAARLDPITALAKR